MLLSFTVGNFLSFKDNVTLSFLASKKITELERNYNNVLGYNVLSNLVILWNNASWKSNLLKAINYWKDFILSSSSLSPNMWIPSLTPFKLDKLNIIKPSFFEYTFIINAKQYRYNFLLDRIWVISEWLYSKWLDDRREKVLFVRDKQNIRVVNFDDKWVKGNVLNNHLALSKFALENSEEALQIYNFFTKIFVFLDWIKSGLDTFEMLKSERNNEFKTFLLDLFKYTSSWINDIEYNSKEQDISQLPIELQQIIQQQPQVHKQWNTKVIIENCRFRHKINWTNDFAFFDIKEESFWTKKVFELAGSLFNIINKWYILFIDELDSSLSNRMIKHIINIFRDKHKHWAQLVFSTNNTNLLDIKDEIFRRDQIYFTNKKEEDNSTDLYTLQDCKIKREDWEFINIRKDVATIEKSYLEWKIKKS